METIMVNTSTLKNIQILSKRSVIALGYFDGLHLGHQEVIKMAKEEAEKRNLPLAVMSFRPHPINIITKGKRIVQHIMTVCQKRDALEQLGVNLFYLVDFTEEFASLTPRQFVKDYLVKLNVEHVVAGFDFSYGAKGAAKISQIGEDSDHQITIDEVPCVAFNNEKISSTAIRNRLLDGIVDEIPQFLGKYFSVKVKLSHNQIQLIEDVILPCSGTYRVKIEQGNNSFSAVVLIKDNCIELLEDIYNNLTENEFLIHFKECMNLPVYERISI